MEIELMYIKDNRIKRVPIETAIQNLYYLDYVIPEEIKENPDQYNRTRKLLSEQEKWIPLYDVYTDNIYLINRHNVYTRIASNYYRFPDNMILERIVKQMVRYHKKNLKKKDPVLDRKIKKAELMIEFMENFDNKILHHTYLKVFHRYAPELGNLTYSCVRKSFIQHYGHLTPYYTKDEIIMLGLNQGTITIPKKTNYYEYARDLDDMAYERICNDVQMNDISASVLLSHQRHIIELNAVGLIQYYTVQGSYFFNQYLRGMTKYDEKNDYLEDLIKSIWNVIISAPVFDNDYYLYRFVSTDEHLKHLRIGDIYTESGFTSTTRDPFYKNDLYKFGFILMKIRIPRKTKGVGLSLELSSHFQKEQEIILAPMVRLKLISKNEKCEYYHPNTEFLTQITTKYEFEWVGNIELIELPLRPNFNSTTQTINFLSLPLQQTFGLNEKIRYMMNKYFDRMNRIRCMIGSNEYYVVGEWFDSTSVYKDLYGINTSDGFSLYTIYKGYTLFIIEIGEIDGNRQMKVNYLNRYIQLDKEKILGDQNLLTFVASIGYYFDIPNIIIYSDYMGCSGIKTITKNMNGQANIHIQRDMDKQINIHLKNGMNKYSKSQDLENKNGNDKDIDDLDDSSDQYIGGVYSVDYYNYFKSNKKRYDLTNCLYAELRPKFSYDELDRMKLENPERILMKEDRDELYQMYLRSYLPNVKNIGENTLDKFYMWVVDNVCYMMDILVDKFSRMYDRNVNPFMMDRYILDGMSYLYNRNLVKIYNRHIIFEINDEMRKFNIPTNKYRDS